MTENQTEASGHVTLDELVRAYETARGELLTQGRAYVARRARKSTSLKELVRLERRFWLAHAAEHDALELKRIAVQVAAAALTMQLAETCRKLLDVLGDMDEVAGMVSDCSRVRSDADTLPGNDWLFEDDEAPAAD